MVVRRKRERERERERLTVTRGRVGELDGERLAQLYSAAYWQNHAAYDGITVQLYHRSTRNLQSYKNRLRLATYYVRENFIRS